MDGITDSMDMSLREFQQRVKNREADVLQSMGSKRVGQNLVTEQQHSNEEQIVNCYVSMIRTGF